MKSTLKITLLMIGFIGTALLARPSYGSEWGFLDTSRASDKWLRAQLQKNANEEALLQWDDRVSGTPLARTETGKALLAYLMARSGLEFSGLKFLANNVDLTKVNSEMKSQLHRAFPLGSRAWEVLGEAGPSRNKSWSKGWIHPEVVRVATRGSSYKIRSRQEAQALLRVLNSLKDPNERAIVLYPLSLYALLEDRYRVAEDMLAELELLEQNVVPSDRIYVARARGFFQEKKFAEALAYYSRIKQDSDYWLMVLEERAWAHLHEKEPDKALSLLHSSRTPIFHPITHSEPFYLSGYIYLKLCDYAEVFSLIKDFRGAMGPKLTGLQNIRDGKSFVKVEETLRKWAQADLDWRSVGTELQTMPLLFYKDDIVSSAMMRWWQPQKEMRIVQSLISKAAPKGRLVGQLMDFKKDLRPLIEAGVQDRQLRIASQRVRDLARSEVTEMGKVIQRLHLIEAESTQRLYAYLQADPNLKGEFEDERKPEGDVLMFPSSRTEFWLDEIDSHRYKVRGCESAQEVST